MNTLRTSHNRDNTRPYLPFEKELNIYHIYYLKIYHFLTIWVQYENSKESKVGDWSYTNIYSCKENTLYGGSYNHLFFRLTFSLFGADLGDFKIFAMNLVAGGQSCHQLICWTWKIFHISFHRFNLVDFNES